MSKTDKNLPKAITVTLIWDAHALNRDEKAGGNILTIKKLSRNGKPYSFLSKTAIRHYLWETLRKAYGWKEAEVISAKGEGEQQVVQFDLLKDNITTSEELALFGYMFTPLRLTRKSAIGITKAIAVESYEGDMAFYANHDLVERLRKEDPSAEPNPFNKEEHSSYYIASFTIDIYKLKQDLWILPKKVKKSGIPEKYLQDKKGIGDEVEIKAKYENGSVVIELGTEKNKHIIPNANLDASNPRIVKFERNDIPKLIKAVLEALHNGLVAQSSGELNTLVPVFFIAAPVRVPVPIFHGRIKAFVNNDGKLQVTGIEDAIKGSEQWLEGGSENIYIYHTNNVSVKEKDIQSFSGQFSDWLEKVLNLNKENIIAIELTKLVKQYKNISFDDVIQILQSIKSILDLYKQNSGNPVDKDTILKQGISEQELEQLVQDGWVAEKTENEGRKVYEPTAKLKEFLK